MKVTEISAAEREKSVSYIQEEIKNVIVNFGDRDPGSEGENKALDYMAVERGGRREGGGGGGEWSVGGGRGGGRGIARWGEGLSGEVGGK